MAVKILEKSRIKEQADVRRVNREIKILKKARHGNIIQLYEVLDTPNTIYLMMENAEGGEMFDYIVAHRYVPEMQACKFFHQIVDGVEMLHKNDITHRDLKPEVRIPPLPSLRPLQPVPLPLSPLSHTHLHLLLSSPRRTCC